MPLTYRRPGVYLEESLLVNSADTASTYTVGCFIGVAGKGPINIPTRVDSWSDYVTIFGGFGLITPPDPADPKCMSYLPYSVYSYFQSGGRTCYVIRGAPSAPEDQGTAASVSVNGAATGVTPLRSFSIRALSAGVWGNKLKYNLSTQSTVGTGATAQTVFAIQVVQVNADGVDEVVETFSGLSVTGGVPGTRRADTAINDPVSGSQYIKLDEVNETQPAPVPPSGAAVALAGGIDPDIPDPTALVNSAKYITSIEGPIMINLVGYHPDASKIDTDETATTYVGVTVPSQTWPERQDIFVINDSAPPRLPNQPSSAYKTSIASPLGANTGDSYSASYGPWILVPNPNRLGDIVSVPPGGAVMGVAARVDATVGVFRAPAGMIAGISNAVGVQTKFTDTELGDLNSQNINIIRPVVGAGICVMGARTRKTFGADRYVSARRTLIYIKEVLKRSTQFAVFENNDQRLWSALMMSADRILRPLWEAGGLKGSSAVEAYYIRCDDVLNSPAVIQSGEVRMEIGVALQYPAEFVIIRITQFDRGSVTREVQPQA